MSSEPALKLSLWLIPPESFKPASALSKLTTTTFPSSANFPSSPGFPPHITLTSRIPQPHSALLPTLNLGGLAAPEIEFSELAHGDNYFKYIFLRIRRSKSLLALVEHVRKGIFPADSFDAVSYDPHISLVYSNEAVTEKRVEYVAWKTSMVIGDARGWTGGKILLVDTSGAVHDWTIVEEYVFP
jgi:2',3'-cyclic-nucleotide 3'-phosphodiesterase